MSRLGRAAASVALVLVMVTGAYVMADVYDYVPGMLTLRERPVEPAPFPTAPGAIEPQVPAQMASGLSPLSPQLSDQEAIEETVTAFLAKEEYLGPHVGISVVDALTGQPIIGRSADESFTPASTAKTLTAIAALDRLGPERTFTTSIVQDGLDSLTLVGGGDVLLNAGAGNPEAINGRAGLADLADKTAANLRLSGVNSVSLTVDDSLFEAPAIHSRWPESSTNRGYIAGVMPLGVDGGKLSQATNAGRSRDPALDAGRTFAQLLEDRGITVNGQVRRVKAPSGARQIAAVESAPLWQIVEHLMTRSDNTVTDVVCRMIAADAGLPTTFSGGAQAVVNQLSIMGIDTAGTRLTDCSGLAGGSSLSPRFLTSVIAHVHNTPNSPHLAALTGMPLGGVEGTLSQRFVDGNARALVRAKTGSLSSVVTLAGSLVTIDGRELIFAVMLDQVPVEQSWNARASMDIFIQQLAGCGCAL